MQLPGKGTHLYEDVAGCYKLLLRGTVIAVDPSIGSNSSMPGVAVYEQGKLVSSRRLELPLGKPKQERLQELNRLLRGIYKLHNPDVLVYEDVAPQRYGGGNAEAHASLLKSIGAILAIPGPVAYVRMKPVVWKRLVRDTYVKGDVQDAEEIGWIALQVAQLFLQKEQEGREKEEQKKAEIHGIQGQDN